jgi:hypothetical protein
MAIEITDLSQLNSDDIQQNLDQIIATLQEDNPTLDLSRGVFKDLLATYHASLSTAEQETLARYLSARSLQQIEQDPTLADADVTDDVLSNYRVVRQPGQQATGEITVVVSSNVTVTISSGAIFESNGKQFSSDSVFTAKSEAGQINASTDRLLKLQDDGNYFFTIDVTAVDVGVDSILAKDAALIPASPPPNFVKSFATNDFVDGRDLETNTELIQRFQEGISCKAPSNRTNMKAMLREISDEAYVGVLHSSIVGFGDEEQLRDQHTIWPGSLGGRADWYIRTQEKLQRVALIKTATLIEKSATANEGTWQLSLTRDDAPGFYEVRSVRLPGASEVSGTFAVSEEIRGLDVTGTGFTPDIETVEEGAYSRYQTEVIKFVDTVTDHTSLSVGDTKDYDVEVALMPLVGSIQDDLNDRDLRSYGADVLIKAPVPIFLSLSFTLAKQNNQPDPDLEAIKDALAQEVNTIPFIGRLYASQLHDIIHGFLGSTTSAGAIDMFGRIRYPDGTDKFIRSSELLQVDGPSDQMVSPKTVQFFLDAEDIAISVETSVPVAS